MKTVTILSFNYKQQGVFKGDSPVVCVPVHEIRPVRANHKSLGRICTNDSRIESKQKYIDTGSFL